MKKSIWKQTALANWSSKADNERLLNNTFYVDGVILTLCLYFCLFLVSHLSNSGYIWLQTQQWTLLFPNSFPFIFPSPFLSAVLSVPCLNSSLHSSPLFSPSVPAGQTMALCWWIWARRTAPHCCTLSCWRARSCCTRSDPPCSPEWPRLWWLWVGSNMHSHIVILKCIQIYSNRYNLFSGLDFSKAFLLSLITV